MVGIEKASDASCLNTKNTEIFQILIALSIAFSNMRCVNIFHEQKIKVQLNINNHLCSNACRSEQEESSLIPWLQEGRIATAEILYLCINHRHMRRLNCNCEMLCKVLLKGRSRAS